MAMLVSFVAAACAQMNVEEETIKINGPKYRIAVVEFRDEFSGVGGTAAGTGNAGRDVVNAYVNLLNKAVGEGGPGLKTVGAGASKMLETALVKSGNFEVFTRQEMDKVMKEQALGQSGAITPQSAAKVGQLIGVNAIVIGTVTEFGEKKSGTSVSGQTMRALTGGNNRNQGLAGMLLSGGLGFSKAEARVVIDVQLIDTTTGRIILAESSEGKESSMGISIAGISTGSSIDDTQVGKALRKSIRRAGERHQQTDGEHAVEREDREGDGARYYHQCRHEFQRPAGLIVSCLQKGRRAEGPVDGRVARL